MSDRLDVVGTGSMVLDVIHLVPRIIGADEKLLVEATERGAPVQRLVGGVTLNHLGWARVLGLRVGIFGKQADDEAGRLLRSGMDRLGIERDIDLTGTASSCAEVFVGEGGERAIYMQRGATGELGADELEGRFAHLIERAEVFTTEVSQLPLASVLRGLEVARRAGARTVVDLDLPLEEAVPALGDRAELERVLEAADVIKPAEVALSGLVSTRDPERGAEELAGRFGASAVALTLGANGAFVFADGDGQHVRGVAVEVVDTTGAGDAFLGGFVCGLRLDLGWERAARLGNACGAACCEQVGAFPDDPSSARERVLGHLKTLGESALPLPGLERGELSGEGALERFLRTAVDEIGRSASELPLDALREAARSILDAEALGGRVHVTGIGKPEHVAHYTASLLSSTGTPATFLHGTEATHGSVGQLGASDVVIAISNSGETPELLAAVEAARAFGVRVIAVTSGSDTPLAKAADHVLVARVAAEGGPLGLAPRASILAETLVLQALTVELQDRRSLTREQYHRRHPAGKLGRLSDS